MARDGEGYDIVAVSETWFSEQSNWKTGIQSCRIYKCDGKEKRGRGAAMWVKDSIVSRERHGIKEGINGEDLVWIEIRDWKEEEIETILCTERRCC